MPRPRRRSSRRTSRPEVMAREKTVMAQGDETPGGRWVALVTGGAKGIGAAIAARLSRDGFAVMVNYHRSGEAAAALVDRLRAEGAEAECGERPRRCRRPCAGGGRCHGDA